MRVWFAIPTARPTEIQPCVDAWRARGYLVALLYETRHGSGSLVRADYVTQREAYNGWADAVNFLWSELRLMADIMVTGGDDNWPDSHRTADEIAGDFVGRFPDLFGVMQPSGDGFSGNLSAAPSPWLGAGWCNRAYGGAGPLWPEYFHFYADGELREVAELYGAWCERPDLCQRHEHWTRVRGGVFPPHMVPAQSRRAADRDLFEARQAAGWPGSAPLATSPREIVNA